MKKKKATKNIVEQRLNPKDDAIKFNIAGSTMSLLELSMYIQSIVTKAKKNLTLQEYLILDSFLDLFLSKFKMIGYQVGEELEERLSEKEDADN